MISVYGYGETDYSHNGAVILQPASCTVKELAGGSFEAELVHPMTADMRWASLQEECILRIPVPAQNGLAQRTYNGSRVLTGDVFSFVLDVGADLTVRPPELNPSGNVPSQTGHVNPGDQVIVQQPVHEDDTSVLVTTEDGSEGYVQIGVIDTAAPVAYPRIPRWRYQLFRIYEVEKDVTARTVTVHARHVSYDGNRNILGLCKMEGMTLDEAVDNLMLCQTGSTRQRITSFVESGETLAGDTSDMSFQNIVYALLDPEAGLAAKYRAQVFRHNWDFWLLPNDHPRDIGYSIDYGKNMTGVKWKVSTDTLCTRILPVGKDKEGNPVMLPEIFVDSPYIAQYPQVYIARLDVSEAKVDDKGTDLQKCYELMRSYAMSEFAKFCDMPTVELEVSFVNLSDAAQYAQYRDLETLFLYDVVYVRHTPFGLSLSAQMCEYEWDAIALRYNSIRLGSVFDHDVNTIAGYELPAWGISGSKLMPYSIGPESLRDGGVTGRAIAEDAVESEHIQDGAVTTGKIAQAAIQELTADIASFVKAHIASADISDLTAQVATLIDARIASAAIDTTQITDADILALRACLADIAEAEIASATIQSAQIGDLSAAVAGIADARIGSATIDWANISHTVGETAIVTRFVGEQMFIDHLAISEANIIDLTAGSIMLRDQNGAFVRLSVDEHGDIMATPVLVEGGNIQNATINGAMKLIENSITANVLNAQDIFADNALVKRLIAANIDVDTLFARQAVVTKLTTGQIASAMGASLDLSSNQSIGLTVRSAVSTAMADAAPAVVKIDSSRGTAFKSNTMSTELRARVYWNGECIEQITRLRAVFGSAAFLQWEWRRSSDEGTADEGWHIILSTDSHVSQDGFVFTVTPADVDSSITFRCSLLDGAQSS